MSDPGTGYGDFHNHLVPAVDDGSTSLGDAAEGLTRMFDAGFRRVVTTPHLDASLVSRSEDAESYLARVTHGFEDVRTWAAEHLPDMDFRRGHEVRMDVPECDFSDERLRLGGTRFVLVEWPRFLIPAGSAEILASISAAGFRVVLAHPERYAGMTANLEVVPAWQDAGAYLQMNYGSIAGRYGPEVRDAAMELLSRGWVHYLCSDFHGRPSYGLYKDDAAERLVAAGADEQLRLLGVTNPWRLFRDEPPLPVPPLTSDGWWVRLRRWLS